MIRLSTGTRSSIKTEAMHSTMNQVESKEITISAFLWKIVGFLFDLCITYQFVHNLRHRHSNQLILTTLNFCHVIWLQ